MEIEMELISILGEDELKNIGEQIAEIVRQHGLQNSPDVCRKIFDYLSQVIDGWNFDSAGGMEAVPHTYSDSFCMKGGTHDP